MSTIALAQTQAESQKIHQMMERDRQNLLNSGITQGPTQSPAAIRREEQALEEAKATANYMLRVCADKRFARLLLKRIAAEQTAIDRSKTSSARPVNVIVNVNMAPYRLPSYNSGSSYLPNHSSTTRFQPDGTGGGYFYRDGRQIGRFQPDGTGGGTFYGE